ncbi:methylosome protein WDR77-like [Epargyreus clarus]|uniref:methylosome protein WDR77-like n=1 Tax=Epargyreus clarus TaxID=520877 RepID=UPI003C2BDAF1
MVLGGRIGPQMENDMMVPPHLNAEVYRTDTTGTLTQSYWEYIRFHPDGTMIIGCSELTGRYWDGGLIVGTLPEAGKDIDSSTKKAITSNSSTADGYFIETSNKVLLCEDSGALSIWSCGDDVWKVWLGDITVAEHDDAIMAVDRLDKDYVTVGADGNIKVWDISQMVSVRSYNAAHSMAINGVAVKPNSSSTFATVSSDQYVSLWDDNTSKPVCDVLKNDCGVRCAQWLDENKLIFGDEAGILRLVDIRNPEGALKLTEFPAAVHRVNIDSESSKMAVCCDNKIVTVCDVTDDSKLRIIYENRTLHTNYVRGCAWDLSDNNVLYTVGYDGALRTHNISNNDV